MAKRQPDLNVFTVIGKTSDGEDMHRLVGNAWSHKDGGCYLKLFATPINGEIKVFRKKDKSEATTS